ncbi:VOC family protein [Staphylococcus edaphicus]
MIQSINHVTYSVSNIKESITFYKDILKVKILIVSDKIIKINII